MFITRKMWALLATLALFGASAAAVLSVTAATAATSQCGMKCSSIYNKGLGLPGPVEDILNGVAAVGQPVILKPNSSSDPSEDEISHVGTVSSDYAAGMISADAYSHFAGSAKAVQIEYAPGGVVTGLCVGLDSLPHENQGLTLQPCSTPYVTVWILDFGHSPVPGYFAIINSATTDFSHPFAMSLNSDETSSDQHLLQILVRRLQWGNGDKTLPDDQLWNIKFGSF
jgi:hypothetical protein